ncbi:amino acid adenylation domain-containing protein [uncultured Phascolarctobacterium sp.]|uniref:amino acid adenylation domain-containing protein n=1 Tax=uncultured Phascolarctobacterium sp. TaxID=512296 RepID=UPI0025F505C0|nr:amino acid adenylation domain-containing protein [uncultured Phascolarctobacterium sp.]
MVRLATDYLDDTAEKYPNKVAFVDSNRTITFSELKKEALHIASSIISVGFLGQPIAIYLDKSVESIVAFMAVAYSGNFYTPLDTKMPISRIKKILATLKPECVLTDRKHAQEVKLFADKTLTLYYEDSQINNIDYPLIKQRNDKIVDTDVLYVLFTSGSTGIPKGVTISHKSLIAYTEWVTDAFVIDEHTILGNQTPFYFSMSVLDIFQTLRNACTMHIIPKSLFSFPIKLLEYIAERKINFIYWVPSVLCLVANFKALGRRDISCLKKILFAGEVMPAKQLNMWRTVLPDSLFANLFGPTEVTDICCFYIVDREISDSEPVPIGNSCKNAGIFILNESEEATEKGELCVRGSILAYGYFNNLEKTAEKFVQNPLNKSYPETIYKTGDLVHYNNFGELIYDGRKDFQIKHMGYRVELGEIETAVYSIKNIMECCAIYNLDCQKIKLFYTGQLEKDELHDSLKTILPEYMLPNEYVHLDRLPLNMNGKIDRVKLKDLL